MIQYFRYLSYLILLSKLLFISSLSAQSNDYLSKLDSMTELINNNSDSAFILLQEYSRYVQNDSKNHYLKAKLSEKYGDYYFESEDLRVAKGYYLKASMLYEQTDSVGGIIVSYINIGQIYNLIGEQDSSLIYLFRAEKLASNSRNDDFWFDIYRGIGMAYTDVEDYDRAVHYFFKAFNNLNEEADSFSQTAAIYKNIGIIHSKRGRLDSAVFYYSRSIDIYNRQEDSENLAIMYNNLGVLFERKEQFDSTLHYYIKALNEFEKINYKYGMALCLSNIGITENKLGNYREAIKRYEESNLVANDAGLIDQLFLNYNNMSLAYEELGSYKQAYLSLLESNYMYDSLNVLDQKETIAELETRFESEKKEQQIQIQAAEITLRKRQSILLSIILILVVFLSVYVIFNSLRWKKANKLLSERNSLLSVRNKQITQSITYASFIQKAVLPTKEYFDQVFTESFIFYKPKDIVSGDFYWINKKDDKIILAVADCTGHGVPGAIMSMMGITFMQEITDNYGILEPNQILNTLRDKIVERLESKNSSFFARDGIEMAVCIIDKKNKQIEYSGAYSPALLVSGGGQVELVPNKIPIGMHRIRKSLFTKQNVPYNEGDVLYLFTDGYMDQFGGSAGKKYGRKRFTELLIKNHTLTIDDQFYSLINGLKQWQGKMEQIDDITILGIKL